MAGKNTGEREQGRRVLDIGFDFTKTIFKQVPTLLVYPHGSSTPTSWGFLAETAQEISGAGDESREWFKIMLDENLLEQMRQKSSEPSKVPRIHEVEHWYVHSLVCFHDDLQARRLGTQTTSSSSIEPSKRD